MRKTISIAIFVLLLLAAPGACFAKEDTDPFPPVPTSSIYIQDYAYATYDTTKNAIMNISTNLNKKTKAQVVVVTIKTLDDMPIQEYAHGLFRKWGIGNKEKNNGVLILVVTSTKQVRIEVGYGLEGRLPDAKCGEIIRDKMQPQLKAGAFNAGIMDGYHAVVDEVSREYGIDPASLTEVNAKPKDSGLAFPIIFFGGLFIIMMVYAIYRFFVPRRYPSGDGAGYYDSGSGSDSGGYSGDSGGGGDSFGGGDSGGGGADS
ncbi:MAG: TPM domain-containing protein [Negativicutes bacterium]|nr:TPM domain-containing protein [Negativicutes bacterium]MDR3588062.1 TPM domain-containing protein [Negativicutes bacterium]